MALAAQHIPCPQTAAHVAPALPAEGPSRKAPKEIQCFLPGPQRAVWLPLPVSTSPCLLWQG